MTRSPFDRLTPDDFRGRLKGAFELDHRDVENLRVDVPIVIAAVLIPRETAGKKTNQTTGDTIETIVFEPREVLLVEDPNLRERILDAFPQLEQALPFPIGDQPRILAQSPVDVTEVPPEMPPPGVNADGVVETVSVGSTARDPLLQRFIEGGS